MFPDSTLSLDKSEVREMGKDVAVVHAVYQLAGQVTPAGEPAAERSTVLSFTFVRQPDGGWLAVSAQNADRMPGAQTYVATGTVLVPSSGCMR